MEAIWFLIYGPTEERFDNLTLGELKKVIEYSSDQDLDAWFAWRKEMRGWSRCSDIREIAALFIQPPAFSFTNISSPAKSEDSGVRANTIAINEESAVDLETLKNQTEIISESSLNADKSKSIGTNTDSVLKRLVETSSKASQIKDRRKFERIKLRFKIIIVNKNESFVSKTRDISSGGVALETNFPQSWNGSHCEVFITHPELNRTIKFNALLIYKKNGTCSLSFGSSNDYFELQKWLQQPLPAAKYKKPA